MAASVALVAASGSAHAQELFSQYGILDLTANGGINPNTGVAWQLGDQYRLAFHTVGATGNFNGVSNNPEDYNDYVTAEAQANPALIGSTWKAMVTVNLDSTTTQLLSPKSHVRDNTGTDDLTGGSGIGGAGVPVYAMDGTTAIARNNADIWNGWSNPFDGDSVVRVVASQNVHYSPFLDQFGNQTVTPNDVHGIDVATGADRFGNHVNALGDTTDNTTFNRGNSNANNTSRIWNRFTDANSTSRSFYALSEILIVGDGTPPPALSLEVNTVTGAMTLLGDDNGPVTINYYQITSAGNSLGTAGWNSLADQDYEGNGPANGTGNGWEEGGGSGPHALAEAYLLGESDIPIGEQINLGTAYNTAVDAQDLVFTYRNDAGFSFDGIVEYVTTGPAADLSGDGDVDDEDLGLFFSAFTGPDNGPSLDPRADLSGDGDVDDEDLGIAFSEFTGPLGPVNVPEPSSAALLGLLATGLLRRSGPKTAERRSRRADV